MSVSTGTLADAWQLSRSGHFDAALALATDLVDGDRSNPGALRLLATLTLQNGDHRRALALFERILTLSDFSADARVEMAEAQRLAGDLTSALASFRQVLDQRPRDTTALRGLAQCHHDLGNRDEALATFRSLVAIVPYDRYAAHMVAALSGENAHASAAYVADLFDAHAEDFDTHLVDVLHYDIPTLIADMAASCAPSTLLDLGCGTGLVGAALHATGATATMDGVDIAPQMIRKASERGLYRHLHAGDLLDTIGHVPELAGPYELVTAADVFVYLGPLDPIFTAVTTILAPGGLFAFSVESAETGVALRTSGRFAHGNDHVEHLAATHGFTILTRLDLPIRHERSRPIPGMLYLLRHEPLDSARP